MTDNDDSSEQSALEGNPFAALFPSITQAVQYASQVKTSDMVTETLKSTHSVDGTNEKELDVKRIVNNLLQRIFLITLQECKSLSI
jgi:hypothetical protein